MDYINKSPKKKPSKEQLHQSKKIKVVGALFILVILLAVVIFSLTQNKENSSVTADVQKSAVAAKNADDDFQIPDKPDPKYDYPETLKNDKPSSSTDYIVPESTPHQIRCGAFRKESDAQRLKNKIAKFTPMRVKRSGDWFVVISPDLPSKRRAENLKNQIKTKVRVYECVLRKRN